MAKVSKPNTTHTKESQPATSFTNSSKPSTVFTDIAKVPATTAQSTIAKATITGLLLPITYANAIVRASSSIHSNTSKPATIYTKL